MNKILKLGVFLAVVSAIAGGALAFANEMTAPVIAANNEKTEKAALLQMYPDASESDFEEVEFKSESTTVQKVYKYNDLFIFNMKVSGYKDGTTFLVSINSNDKTIEKIAIKFSSVVSLSFCYGPTPSVKSRIFTFLFLFIFIWTSA